MSRNRLIPFNKDYQKTDKVLVSAYTSLNDFFNHYGSGFCRISEETKSLTLRSAHNCREVFHSNFRSRTNYFAYRCINTSDMGAKNIPEFLNKFEIKMGLKPSQFYITKEFSTHLIVVQPNKFWLKNSLRRNLLTILIKVGRSYKSHVKGSFSRLLYNNRYIKYSKPALLKFMQGYTCYNGRDFVGWCTNLNHDLFIERLKRPL